MIGRDRYHIFQSDLSSSGPIEREGPINPFDNRWMEKNWYYVAIVVIVFLLCFWALLHYFCKRRRHKKEMEYQNKLLEQIKILHLVCGFLFSDLAVRFGFRD